MITENKKWQYQASTGFTMLYYHVIRFIKGHITTEDTCSLTEIEAQSEDSYIWKMNWFKLVFNFFYYS